LFKRGAEIWTESVHAAVSRREAIVMVLRIRKPASESHKPTFNVWTDGVTINIMLCQELPE
jgi:hypothetical protein